MDDYKVTGSARYERYDIKTTKYSLEGKLRQYGQPMNRYGNDIANLILRVENQSLDRLRVHIYDEEEKQFQIPDEVLPYPANNEETECDLSFNYVSKPFGFWITRSKTLEVIFDTRTTSIPINQNDIVDNVDLEGKVGQSKPLIFSDQYLQISTQLPADANIYGLGEQVGGLRLKEGVSTLRNTDNPAKEGNTMYGSHPFYMETRWPDVPRSGLKSGIEDDNKEDTQRPTDQGEQELKPGTGSKSHGVFLRNSHGTDILLRAGMLQYKVLGGTLDFYFLAGPKPIDVVRQYREVVGKPAEVPDWAFGFHLSRWGGDFATVEGMKGVVQKMEDGEIPLEVLWSDLDYMDRKRNFEVDEGFKKEAMKDMIDWLHRRGQRYIPLIDAAIAVPKPHDSYTAYERGQEMDIWIKAPGGSPFYGQVWPGLTVFPDWTNPKAKVWWKECFESLRAKIEYDGIWYDMAEPASFTSNYDLTILSTDHHETKLRKVLAIEENRGRDLTDPCAGEDWRERQAAEELLALEGSKRRGGGDAGLDFPPYLLQKVKGCLGSHTVPPSCHLSDGSKVYNQHNLHGMQGTMAIRDALVDQKPDERPFIVSRSTFAGQGRVSAHWLGDNDSDWDSMRHSIPGVLQFQILQVPMVGPDACGFYGAASEELCVRWMQLAAFFPFYRNHNHIDAPGQEPYRWKSVSEATKKAISIRYSLLPVWKSLFAQANLDGTPPLRPLFFEFDEPKYRDVERQFLIGSSLLVTPVLEEGATSVTGYFPSTDGTFWVDFYTHEVLKVDGNDKATLPTPLGHIPLHIRSGSISLMYDKPGLTIEQTKNSKMTILICLDDTYRAQGEFVLDDGKTINGPKSTVKIIALRREVGIRLEGDFPMSNLCSRLVILQRKQGLDQMDETVINLPEGRLDDDLVIRW